MDNEIKPPGMLPRRSANGDLEGGEPKRKLPAWAIWLVVLGFIIFNSFFAMFAIQMGNGGGN